MHHNSRGARQTAPKEWYFGMKYHSVRKYNLQMVLRRISRPHLRILKRRSEPGTTICLGSFSIIFYTFGRSTCLSVKPHHTCFRQRSVRHSEDTMSACSPSVHEVGESIYDNKKKRQKDQEMASYASFNRWHRFPSVYQEKSRVLGGLISNSHSVHLDIHCWKKFRACKVVPDLA